MEIASSLVHRVLTYICIANEQKAKVTTLQVDAYADLPNRPRLLSTTGALGDTLRRLIEGPPGSVSQWLSQLGWINVTDDNVAITDLGRAICRHLDKQEIEVSPNTEIVLSPHNSFSYARVIQKLARHEDAMLVDPYFGLDQLEGIAEHTSITRVLTTSKGGKERVAGLAAGLVAIDQAGKSLEVRVTESSEMHDRYVIPDSGEVDFLGTSLNGVGKRFTVMGSLGSPAADAVRSAFMSIWDSATPLRSPRVTAPNQPPHESL